MKREDLMGFWENEARISARAGFILPFALFAIGLYGLFTLKYDTSGLVEITGTVQKYKTENRRLYIYIDDYKEPYFVAHKNDINSIQPKLEHGAAITIWVLKNYLEIDQATVNGEMAFYYSYKYSLFISLGFTLVGAIFIPFFIRARIKDAKYFGDENIIFRKQWRKPFSEDR